MKKHLAICGIVFALTALTNSPLPAQADDPSPKEHFTFLQSGSVDPSLLERLRSLDHRVKQAALQEARQMIEEGKDVSLVGKPLDEFLDAVMKSELAPGQYSGEIGGGISMSQKAILVALTKYRHDEAQSFTHSLLKLTENQQKDWGRPSTAIAALAETADERSLQPLLARVVEDTRNNVTESASVEVLKLAGWKIVPAVLNYFHKERAPFETKVIGSIFKDIVGKDAANAILNREIEKRQVRRLLRVNEIAPDFLAFVGSVELYRLARDGKGLVELRRYLNDESATPIKP